ncbi:hypothetical protein [Cohnella sp.]|uniref:hypothetical protein n=1 Tax=Cohnella sp. TaxID=1883426 RepID=UPI0035632E81
MKKVIIFGLGSGYNKIIQILDYTKVEVIGHTDNDLKKIEESKLCNVIKPEEICRHSFDYIVVASLFFSEIFTKLVGEGISSDKIVNGVSIYDSYLPVQRLLSREKIDLFVTGMSYAAGIEEELLRVNAVNLAFAGQDLLLDYCLAKQVIHSRIDRLPKFSIIGLAYYQLNYEFIKTRKTNDANVRETRLKAFPGLVSRYYHLSSNYDPQYFNAFYQHQAEEARFCVYHSEIFVSIKDKYTAAKTTIQVKNEKPKMVVNADQRKDLAKKLSSKYYHESVLRNQNILAQYLELLVINDIKPIIVIHPQHPDFVRNFSPLMVNRFINLLDTLRQSYNFQLIDCFESNIVGDDDFKDLHHLSLEGNRKFTQYLNNNINWV